MKQLVILALLSVAAVTSTASPSRYLAEEDPLYLKSGNGTTIAAFIDDNNDGENDLGDNVVSFRIESQPEVKGREEPEYPKEVDTQGEETYDDEEALARAALVKKIAKKRLLLPEIALIEPKSR